MSRRYSSLRVAGLLTLLVAAFAPLLGQTSPQTAPPPPTGVIVGQVIDAATGTPVENAKMELIAIGAVVSIDNATYRSQTPGGIGAAAPSGPLFALTNTDGNFIFRPVSKGTYGITADAPGYVLGHYGQSRLGGPIYDFEWDDTTATARIAVKIWKFAAVSGTVLDESGQPAVGVTVRVLQQQTAAGKQRLVQGASAQTDDRGVYRIASLMPGRYFVVAPFSITNTPTTTVEAYQQALTSGTPAAATPGLIAMGAPFVGGASIRDQQLQISNIRSNGVGALTATGELLSYQTVFYPSGSGPSQASIIALGSGEERSANLQLRLVRTVRVSGSVSGPDGPAPRIVVRLVPADASDLATDNRFETATTMSDDGGRFTFLGVPSGQYTLKAQRTAAPPGLTTTQFVTAGGIGTRVIRTNSDPVPIPEPVFWAQQPLTVGETEITGLPVSLSQGIAITGRIEFESTKLPRPGSEKIASLTVSVLQNERGGPEFWSTPFRPDTEGRFTTARYAPGKYVFTVATPGAGWLLKSMTAGGREVSMQALDLTGDITDAVITFTDQVAELSGAVKDGTALASDAAVFLFPFDYRSWLANGAPSLRSKTATVGKSGAFVLGGLITGDYIVVAVSPDAPVDLQDPAWLARLASIGTRVAIGPGEKKRQDLSVSRLR
jgi:protocatechuate 3,4-dioxygenase beta subunit